MFILTTFKLMRSNSKILCHNFQLDINTFKYCCWWRYEIPLVPTISENKPIIPMIIPTNDVIYLQAVEPQSLHRPLKPSQQCFQQPEPHFVTSAGVREPGKKNWGGVVLSSSTLDESNMLLWISVPKNNILAPVVRFAITIAMIESRLFLFPSIYRG